jgi:hypothetical protein
LPAHSRRDSERTEERFLAVQLDRDRADHAAAVPSHERRGEMIDEAGGRQVRALEQRQERDKISFRRWRKRLRHFF